MFFVLFCPFVDNMWHFLLYFKDFFKPDWFLWPYLNLKTKILLKNWKFWKKSETYIKFCVFLFLFFFLLFFHGLDLPLIFFSFLVNFRKLTSLMTQLLLQKVFLRQISDDLLVCLWKNRTLRNSGGKEDFLWINFFQRSFDGLFPPFTTFVKIPFQMLVTNWLTNLLLLKDNFK